MPELAPSQELLTLQYVVIGLPRPACGPRTGAQPGFCLATEYSTSCDTAVDASVCAWQNVRFGGCPAACPRPN